MPHFNVKVYLVLSGVLAIVLIILVAVPLSRRAPQTTINNGSSPSPTTSEVKPGNEGAVVPTIAIKDFTGVTEETLPESVAVPASEKQTLRNRIPFDTGLFKIDFDYSEDRFKVTLNEPKTDNLKQFEDWKKNEYPQIPMDQFIFE